MNCLWIKTTLLLLLLGHSSAASDQQQNPEDVLNKLFQVNQIWLFPKPAPLRYGLVIVDYGHKKETRKPYYVHILDQDRARLDSIKFHTIWEHLAIFSKDREAHVFQMDKKPIHRNVPKGDFRFLQQGYSLDTGLHVLGNHREHFNLNIQKETKDPTTIVLEAQLKTEPGEPIKHFIVRYGHDLYCIWWGFDVRYEIRKIKIGVQLPHYIPLYEEIIGRNDKLLFDVKYGPEFFQVGKQRAPKTLHAQPHTRVRHGFEGTAKAEFQIVNGNWLIKSARLLRKEKVVAETYSQEISCEPISPDGFNIQHALPKDYKPPERFASLKKGDQAVMEYAFFPCKGSKEYYDFTFYGGSPFTVKLIHQGQTFGPINLTKEEMNRFDNVLDYIRNPHPNCALSTLEFRFKIRWLRKGQKERIESFTSTSANWDWERYTGMTIFSLIERIKKHPER